VKVLDRHNILELIGKDRRKYHSAIITCYSYDFSFFEERILAVLRTANIKNVNVFCDGKFLETTLEHTTGKEFRANKTYSLTPVYSKGVFHPKILMLIGQRQGLLIIGSGNLTGSGICSNDEIWGAFQFSSLECEHSNLFLSVWEYLLSLYKHAKGFVPQTLDWITKYSLWLQELPKQENSWVELKSKQQLQFLFNSNGSNIFNQLVDLLPKGKPQSVSIISPFYDRSGELIQEIKETYNPKELNCIVQSEFGLLPLDYKSNSVNFYEWNDCFETAKRLHGKLFHFQYQHEEFLLIGSPNATTAALGGRKISSMNDEACLLLNRPLKNSYLDELGIKFPSKTILLSKIESKNQSDVVAGIKSKFKISYVELRGNKLSIYLNKYTAQKTSFKLFDVDGTEIETIQVEVSSDLIEIEIAMTEQAFKICLNDDKERVSNFMLIHRVEFLLKNNPDPKQEKLDELLENILANNTDNITDIFSHVSFNWADEDEEPFANPISFAKNQKEKEIQNKTFQVLDETTFNTVSKQMLLKQEGILTSSNIRIADFLGALGAELNKQQKEIFEDSEEAKQLMQSEGGEGQEIKRKIRIVSDGEREKRAIFKFFKKLNDSYYDFLEPFYTSNGIDHPKQKVSIKGLSNLLIALEVYHIYYGKRFATTEKGIDDKEIIKEHEYLPEGNISSYDCAKWFLCDILGKFLIISTEEHKVYDYDLLKNKQTEMRKNAFYKSVFAVLNISWGEKFYAYRESLLLNLLFYLNPEKQLDKSWIERLNLQLQSLEEKAKRIHHSYQDNRNYFFNSLLPKFIQWTKIYADEELKKNLILDLSNVQYGATIFKKSLGFAEMINKKQNGNKNTISLRASGFDWDENEEQSILHDMQVGTKIVKFN
jgi:hypothetical protein